MLAGLILIPLSMAGTANELRTGVTSQQTPVSVPTPTIEPAAAQLPSIAPGQEVTPTAPPPPLAVNDVPIAAFVVMTDDVRQNVRAISMAGRQLGNDPRAFSAIGDSTIGGGLFLERFGAGKYDLGDYASLQAVIDEFAPSFKRTSVSVRVGQHAWTILNPMWADKKRCAAGESPVDCELRLNKPGMMFIHLGANDTSTGLFGKHMRSAVEYLIQKGVVPVLITKADRREGPANTNNNTLRQLAAEYKIPLLDYDVLAATLPGRGLGRDGVHMTPFYANDYRLPQAFESGHGLHNLAALIALDAVWNELKQAGG